MYHGLAAYHWRHGPAHWRRPQCGKCCAQKDPALLLCSVSISVLQGSATRVVSFVTAGCYSMRSRASRAKAVGHIVKVFVIFPSYPVRPVCPSSFIRLCPWTVAAEACTVRGRHPVQSSPIQANLVQPSPAELDWIGLDWTGLDWTGLDWTSQFTVIF